MKRGIRSEKKLKDKLLRKINSGKIEAFDIDKTFFRISVFVRKQGIINEIFEDDVAEFFLETASGKRFRLLGDETIQRKLRIFAWEYVLIKGSLKERTANITVISVRPLRFGPYRKYDFEETIEPVGHLGFEGVCRETNLNEAFVSGKELFRFDIGKGS